MRNLLPDKHSFQKISTHIRLYIISLLLGSALSFSPSSIAGCNNTSWMGSNITLPFPASISVSSAQNSPINTPLSSWYSTTSSSIVYCRDGGNIVYIWTTLQQSPASTSTGSSYTEAGTSYTIFPTKIPGIGYVLSSSATSNGKYFPTYPLSSITQEIASGNIGIDTTINITVRARLIKTGTLTAANYQLSNQPLAYYAVSTNWASGQGSVYINGTTLSMQNTTCSVNTNNINVTLPPITPAQLPSISSTSGSTPFTINLNCPSNMNVYMTLTDNSNPAQTSKIISAASGSTAQGVGVQVMRNGSALALGPDSSNAGTTNQFQIGTGLSGMVSIPLSASYIRTGTVTGGTLQAKATFTMSYQ